MNRRATHHNVLLARAGAGDGVTARGCGTRLKRENPYELANNSCRTPYLYAGSSAR